MTHTHNNKMITHIQNDKPEWQTMTKYTFLIFQCLQAQDFPNGNPNDLCLMWCMICILQAIGNYNPRATNC